MTITLTVDQAKAIREAIRSGQVSSVNEFIDTALEALPHRKNAFDKEKAARGVNHILELRQGVRLDRQGLSIRDMAHIGPKY
jgi:Arc/MetJ-type ribon-helix-helix transcriptional regulator